MSDGPMAGVESDPPGSRWWIPIAVLAGAFPLLVVLGMVTPPDAFSSLLVAPVALIGFLLTVLSPVFVYLDGQYVRSVSRWEPGGWYYLMILPPLTLLSIVYVYRRHEFVGIP